MNSSFTTLATVALVIAGLYFGRDVLVPFALALLLTFLLAPLVTRLKRWRLGRIPSVVIVVILTLSALGGAGYLVTAQFSQLIEDLPKYQQNLRNKFHNLARSSEKKLEQATHVLNEVTESGPNRQKSGDRAVPVAIQKTPETTTQLGARLASQLSGPLGTAAAVIIFVIFMLVGREDLRDRFLRLIGVDQLHVTTTALDDAAQRVSRYLLMQLIVNATYGLPVGIGLYFIGVPSPFLWGFLAMTFRFVPYAGPIAGALGPIVLSMAVDPGWTMLLYTLALFGTLEIISNNVIEPWLYGSCTGISSLALIGAALFWTSLWGLPGLFLATPLTVCLVVMGTHVPRLEWLSVLLSDCPALSTQARFYQRLLALDAEEPAEIADEFLAAGGSLLQLFETILLPALVLAETDRHAHKLDETRQHFVIDTTRQLIDEITEPVPVTGLRTSVVCLPARDAADEVAATMLAHVLEQHGIRPVTLPRGAAASFTEAIAAVNAEVICVSAVPPQADRHLRFICRRLRTSFPDAKIVACLWNGPEVTEAAAEVAGADTVCLTFAAAAEYVNALQGTSIPTAAAPEPLAQPTAY